MWLSWNMGQGEVPALVHRHPNPAGFHERQLHGQVVAHERPELGEAAQQLADALSEGTIQLQQLEDALLQR